MTTETFVVPISYAAKVATLTKALRNMFGMSQTDLAEATGLSRPTISRLEKLSEPIKTKSETLEQLLDAFRRLGVEVEINEHDVVVRIPNAAMAKALEHLQ